MFNIRAFYLTLCCYLLKQVGSSFQETDGGNATRYESDLVLFKSNMSTCPMRKEFCKLTVYVSDDINITNLTLQSSNKKHFDFMKIEECKNHQADCDNTTIGNYSTGIVYYKPNLAGVAHLNVFYEYKNYSHMVVIIESDRWINKFYKYYIIFFQITTSSIMGILLDVKTIITIVKKPIPALIGFVSQYIGMPLLALTFIKIFNFAPIESLTLFIYNCCPGGAGSNNWTILFSGDLELSAVMTFFSTMSSLVMMPLWLYTVGSYIMANTNIGIPFLSLFWNLCTTIVPCLTGIVLSRMFPKLKAFVMKIFKPVIILVMFLLSAMGFYLYYFIFLLVSWKNLIIFPLLPWSGFIFGGLVALICRQPRNRIVTISIETGIQNFGIATLIVYFNFPSPQKDFAFVPLLMLSFGQILPLYAIFITLTIFRKTKALIKKLKSKTVDEKERDAFIDTPDASKQSKNNGIN